MTEPTIEIQGLKEIIDKLGKVPPQLQKAMNDMMAKSLRVLQETGGEVWYPPYMYKSMKQAYGGFVSDKQRKYVMANIRKGNITPGKSNRKNSGGLGGSLGIAGGGNASVYSISGSGANIQGRYGTDLAYAKYVIDRSQQSRMHQGHWITMTTMSKKAQPKIKKIWDTLVSVVKRKLGLS